MKRGSALIFGALLSIGASVVLAQEAPGGNNIQKETKVIPISSGKWTGARLRDGQPDVQGHWSNTIANHANWTDPQGGVPGDPNPRGGPKGPRESRAPSRVSDPPDGEVPFQPWARAVQQEFLANFHNPTQPQYVEPLARCAPAGVPKSFIWHGFEIRQYPGYVLILFNSGWRIIHLDGKPHLPENIKLWNADSRGRWEGNTLVVDVTNNNAKARLGRTALQLRRHHHRSHRVHASVDRNHSGDSLHREKHAGRLALRSRGGAHDGRQVAARRL